MGANELFLNFGDMPSTTPSDNGQKRRASKSRKQNNNSADTKATDNGASLQQPEAKSTSLIEKKASTPIMDRKKEETFRVYTPDEIMKSSIEYFHGDELAANVWMNKYALRDGDKIYELNPDMMHRRLAREFARIESKYPNPMSEDDIYGLLKDFRYIIPQGSPMSGIGNNFQVVSLSN